MWSRQGCLELMAGYTLLQHHHLPREWPARGVIRSLPLISVCPLHHRGNMLCLKDGCLQRLGAVNAPLFEMIKEALNEGS